MHLYSLDEIRDALQDRNISAVAERTGIHKMTIYNLINNKTNISFSTYKALVNYLFGDN